VNHHPSEATRRKISQTMTGRIRGPYTTPNKTDATYERQTVKKYQKREINEGSPTWRIGVRREDDPVKCV